MLQPFLPRMLLPLVVCCLALPGLAVCGDGAAPSHWQGSYIGKEYILHFGPDKGSAAVSYAFEPREASDSVKAKEGEAAALGGGALSGDGIAFALAPDGASLAVTRADGGRPCFDPQRPRYEGDYVRLVPLTARGKRLVLENGKPLSEGQGELKPVEHSDMRFAIVNAFDVERDKLPVRPGLYLVRPDGEATYFKWALDGQGPEDWENVVAVSLSPDKDILALANFSILQGDWVFFNWPDVRPLDHPRAEGYWQSPRKSPSLLWSGGRQVVVDYMALGGNRPCGYDPCGVVSVVVYDLDTGRFIAPLPGTDLCDYSVRSVKDGKITASAQCLPRVKDWKNFPGKPPQTVVVPLPSSP